MAIRFVDKGPEDHPDRKATPARPEPSGQSSTPEEAPLVPSASEPAQAPFEGLLPTLPHAKPEPKPRGRKKAFG